MRLRRGQLVEIHFLDHCIGATTAPMRFVCWGRLAAVQKDSLTIAGWDYDPPGRETSHNLSDSNRTTWTIVRSAITRIHHLKVEK